MLRKPSARVPSASDFLKRPAPLPVCRQCATCHNKALATDVAEYVELHKAGGTRWSLASFHREYLLPKHGDAIPSAAAIGKHIRKCLKA